MQLQPGGPTFAVRSGAAHRAAKAVSNRLAVLGIDIDDKK
jgi:hypothetical protein